MIPGKWLERAKNICMYWLLNSAFSKVLQERDKLVCKKRWTEKEIKRKPLSSELEKSTAFVQRAGQTVMAQSLSLSPLSQILRQTKGSSPWQILGVFPIIQVYYFRYPEGNFHIK